MQEQQTSGPERSLPTEPTDRWVNDCWFVEVMPPTWTWAYPEGSIEPGNRVNPDTRRLQAG
jgi:hypothetical protein